MNMKKIKFALGQFLGKCEGTNSPESAQMMILKDIEHAQTDIKIVSCTADISYWTEHVMSKLEKKIAEIPTLKVEFLVGPSLRNSTLERLAREGKVKLYRLKNVPPFDLRIVNDCDTYVSNHGGDGKVRHYSWILGNRRAVADRLYHYNLIRKDAA